MTRLFSCVPGTRCVPAPDHRFFDRNDRPRIHRLMMLLICFFGIIACSHRSPDPMTETCAAPSGALFFWTEPEESLAIGKTRTLTPYKADMPGAQEPLSSACLSNIRVSPEAAGSIRKGPLGDHLLVVSSTAPAGLAAYVEADYLGERIRSQFRVFDPTSNPLVGKYWVQDTEGCVEGTQIQELIFSAGGEFSVIWDFFEWQKDCEGRYDYDPETGALDFIQTYGCGTETGLTSGLIEVRGNELVLKTASFGRGPGREEICEAPFGG